MFADEDDVDQDGDAGNVSSEEEDDDDEDSADDGNNDVDGSGNDDDDEEEDNEYTDEDDDDDDEIVFNFKSQRKPKQSVYEAKSLQGKIASAERTKKIPEEVESDKDSGQEERNSSDEMESDDQDSSHVNKNSIETSDSDSDIGLLKAKRKKKDNSRKRKNKKKLKKEMSSVEHTPVEDVFTGRKKGTKLKKINLMEVEGTEDNSAQKSSLSGNSTTQPEEYNEDSNENVETESMDDSEERSLEESSLEMENEEEEEGTISNRQAVSQIHRKTHTHTRVVRQTAREIHEERQEDTLYAVFSLSIPEAKRL